MEWDKQGCTGAKHLGFLYSENCVCLRNMSLAAVCWYFQVPNVNLSMRYRLLVEFQVKMVIVTKPEVDCSIPERGFFRWPWNHHILMLSFAVCHNNKVNMQLFFLTHKPYFYRGASSITHTGWWSCVWPSSLRTGSLYWSCWPWPPTLTASSTSTTAHGPLRLSPLEHSWPTMSSSPDHQTHALLRWVGTAPADQA